MASSALPTRGNLLDEAWRVAAREGIIETTVELAALTSPRRLKAILQRRLQAATVESNISDLFSDDAFDTLFRSTLRNTSETTLPTEAPPVTKCDYDS